MSLGMLIGGVAGYFGGRTDFAIMRIVEVILSIPGLYLILTMRQAFGEKMSSAQAYFVIICVLAFIGWASNARVIRGMVLSLKENEYVTAAEALGASRMRIVIKHILPNTFSFVIVTATLYVPYYILGEVALSFLGVGIQEPEASWGNMLRDAQDVRILTDYSWIVIPGFFIFIAVMAFNFLGDGLRDAADPRTLE
jgi:peptide/nickel transport system permease protein